MKGSTKKPANQGSAGSANVQPPRMPNAAKSAKPSGGATMLSSQPSGTRGSGK
tara:strand:+ start:2114 stop:2272 length:159 start_codon:yes stop_codon:yes gene_type:complete